LPRGPLGFGAAPLGNMFELAGRFYLARRFEKAAYAYMRDARYNYLRWGASGKVRQLDELYPLLKADELIIDPTGTIRTPIEHLDFAAIIKVSQALSGEIVLEKLINTLMRTVLEHAAAERGLLILSRNGDLRIEAKANECAVFLRRLVRQRNDLISTKPLKKWCS
jgi:hypothetical protein